MDSRPEPNSGASVLIQRALDPIAADLIALDDVLRQEARGAADPFVAEVAEYLVGVAGKRLRPTLVLLFGRAGNPATQPLRRAAAAMELMHIGSLYHDDIIDGSAQRRGIPSAHRVYGERVAAFAGNHLFSRAWQILAELDARAVQLAADRCYAVCAGEVNEMLDTHSVSLPIASYLNNIAGKTGALFELSAALGAIVARLSDEQIEHARAYARNFGLAFQIVDDLLDLCAPLSILGKPPGTDLETGVYTLPVLLALKSSHGAALRELLSARPLGKEPISAVIALLRARGFLRAALTEAKQRADAAVAELDSLPPQTRECLTNLVRGVLRKVEPQWIEAS